MLLPFVSIVLAALHPSGAQISGLSVPSTWSWGNFAEAWVEAGFSQLVLSSVIIAVGRRAARARARDARRVLARDAQPVRRPDDLVAFVLGLTLPVELVVVALYYNLQQVGLTNSYLGVILAEAALFMPFGVYWMQTHFAVDPRRS